MPFVDVKLADVELEKPEPVKAGKYVFQLNPGAQLRINKFNGIEELNVSASIAEGDYAGRRVFWNYPDPTAVSKTGKPMTWSSQAMKKLELALGADSLPGENTVEYFNRAASNGAARFGASLVEETRKDVATGEYVPYIRTGETEPRAVFSIFSVVPAA
jgi:hypothetical protein